MFYDYLLWYLETKNKQTNKQKNKQPTQQTNKQTNNQTDKQTTQQTNKQTNKQKNMEYSDPKFASGQRYRYMLALLAILEQMS